MKNLFYWLRNNLWLTFGIIIVVLIIYEAGDFRYAGEYSDDDKDRGATAVGMDKPDAFGDRFSKVIYPDQGWDPSQSLWYYNTTQGSDLLPYDFFLVLEQADSEELFRSPANMNHYRYLVQKATTSNPDALPVGIVKDTYQGESDTERTYVGFTCAACHASQVNYKGTAVRIDGGPSASDVDTFLKDLAKALEVTSQDEAKRERFVKAVLDLGEYDNEAEVLKDLDTFVMRTSMYNIINRSATRYGYARLDAFGRIFNRVLEHLLTKDQLHEMVSRIAGLSNEQVNYIMDGAQGILTANDRDEITRRTLAALIKNGRSRLGAVKEVVKHLRNGTFNSPNAPVSYPFLWDIAQHDFVQWNGIGANAGVGPMGRNVGEVIGVFGTLDWYITDKCRLAEIIAGQCSLFGETTKGDLVRFQSSVNMRNLRKIEGQLKSLQSPMWEDKNLKGVLPELNKEQVVRGKELFEEYCAACHQHIVRDYEYRKVVAFMNDYKKVGTDPKMVENSVGYTGKSGFIKDLYVGASDSSLVLQDRMPVAALLTYATTAVVATPDPDKNTLLSTIEWITVLIKSFAENEVKVSLKQGDYPVDTTHNPYASLQAYKGRPLNGIWATAPYLHNGSVPTLYDLLLPAKCPDTEPGCEKRPETFMVGSRELDPVKVGFKSEGYDGFEFITSKKGNSNKGHEYAAGKTKQPDDTMLPALGYEDRMALVEYMKSL